MSDKSKEPTTPQRRKPDEVPLRKRDERHDDSIHEAEWEPPRDEDVPMEKDESD